MPNWRKLLGQSTDTGWRDVSADLRAGATGVAHVRRVGMHVHFRVQNLVAGTAHAVYWPPLGMRATAAPLTYPPQSSSNSAPFYLDGNGIICRDRTATPLAGNRWWELMYVLPPGTPMPDEFGKEVS